MKNPWTLSRIFIRGSRIVSLEIRDNRVYNEGRDSRRLQSLVSTNVGTGTCKHMDHHRLTVRSIFSPAPPSFRGPIVARQRPNRTSRACTTRNGVSQRRGFVRGGVESIQKDSKGLCTHFGNCYYYVQVLNFAVSKRRDRFSRKIDLIF